MGIACGVLGWTPKVFWRSTPHEFWATFEAWEEANNPGSKQEREIARQTKALAAKFDGLG